MHFSVKNKIPRLHSGVSNAARFLSQSLGFNSFLLSVVLLKPIALKGRFIII